MNWKQPFLHTMKDPEQQNMHSSWTYFPLPLRSKNVFVTQWRQKQVICTRKSRVWGTDVSITVSLPNADCRLGLKTKHRTVGEVLHWNPTIRSVMPEYPHSKITQKVTKLDYSSFYLPVCRRQWESWSKQEYYIQVLMSIATCGTTFLTVMHCGNAV